MARRAISTARIGDSPFDERDHGDPQHVVVSVLFVRRLRHVGRHRSQQPVAQQDAEERAHQRRRHLVADLFGRPAQRAHGDHHAQHRRHDSQSGQRVGHGAQGRNRLLGLVMMHVHVEFHHLIEIERLNRRRSMAMRSVSQTKSRT